MNKVLHWSGLEQWQPYCTRLIFLRHMEELSYRSHAAFAGTDDHGYQTPSHLR